MMPGKNTMGVMKHMVYYLGIPPEHVIFASKVFNKITHDNRANSPYSWFTLSECPDLPTGLQAGRSGNPLPLSFLGNPLWVSYQSIDVSNIPFRRVNDNWTFFYKGKEYLDRTETRLGLPSTCPTDCVDFLTKMLQYDPKARLSIEDAIEHQFLKQI